MASDGSVRRALGIGCLTVFVLGLVLAVASGIWLYRGAKRLEAEMKDPAVRTARAEKILGAETLPAGYHAVVAFSVPFVFDLAILSDREPDARGVIHELGERSLIYVELIGAGRSEQELRDYFEGKASDPEVLRKSGIHIDADEIISRGLFSLGDASLMYVAERGRVSAHGFEGRGITSMCLIDCPGDERMRMAIWLGPDPSPETSVTELDLTSTPADPAELSRFMAPFRFCA